MLRHAAILRYAVYFASAYDMPPLLLCRVSCHAIIISLSDMLCFMRRFLHDAS